MTGRLDFEQAKSNQRMEKLAGFQIKILRSALTRYPDAKRVVYSTCSVFPEENEDVVRQVLETNSSYKLVPATQFVNNTWKNFGSTEYGDIGSYCLYAKPNEDFTNGFFVAVFEKLEEGEENQFFNTKIYNFKKHMQSQMKRKRKQEQIGNNEDNFYNNGHSQNSTSSNFENEEYYSEEHPNVAIKEERSDVTENGSVKKKNKKINNIGENVAINCSKREEELAIKKEKNEMNTEYIQQEVPEYETRKEKKKKKKIKSEFTDNVDNDVLVPDEHGDKKKKKNKKINNADGNIDNNCSESGIVVVKKEKKKKNNDTDKASEIEFDDHEVVVKQELLESDKKKQKKKRKIASEDISGDVEDGNIISVPKVEHDVKKKEKKAKHNHDYETDAVEVVGKKNKKNKLVDNEQNGHIKTEVKSEKIKKKSKKDITA